MIVLEFFFLIYPVEYTIYSNNTTPFRLLGVALQCKYTVFDPELEAITNLIDINFVPLTFTTQKKYVQKVIIRQSASLYPLL